MTRDKSILIKNIYYMLSYAFQTLNQSKVMRRYSGRDSLRILQNLFAAILAKGIALSAEARAMYRDIFRNCQEAFVCSCEEKSILQGTIRTQSMLQ